MTDAPFPEDLVCHCGLCPNSTFVGVPAMVEHLESVHGQTAERWPDGALVVDASDVPELIGDHQ